MTPAEVEANTGRVAIWLGSTPVVIQHLIRQVDPPRAWVRLLGFSSERDVDPTQLTLNGAEGLVPR